LCSCAVTRELETLKKVILFVHGLGGCKETWGNFESLIKSDVRIDSYDVEYYEYPSAPFRPFVYFQNKYASIQALGNGLKTFIDHKLENYEEIVLVGHSLGGLVIRQYLYQEYKNNPDQRIKKIIFYATPQEGSGLANIGNKFSIGHRHLKQICKNSEFLEDFNLMWGRIQIEKTYDFRIVVAAEDSVVSELSATANFRHLAPITIVGKGHKSISKPADKDDMSFLVLRKFLTDKKPITNLKANGCLTNEQWNSRDGNTQYFSDKKRENVEIELHKFFEQKKGVIRIAGLSGLGKTRLVLNSIQNTAEDTKSSVLYIDLALDSNSIVHEVNKWVSEEYTGTIVADNCSPLLHDQLSQAIGRPESKLKLITIDSDIQKSGSCPFIVLSRLDDAVIKSVLESLFKSSLKDIDRIVAFAQGFPQMAVLVAHARLNEVPELGSLTDDYIAEKLIWGGKERSVVDEKVLMGCSLFDRFGLENEASREYEFIAEKIVNISKSDFYDCVKRFAERGLIDRRGRFGQLVPKPLAIRLAAQWWTRTHSDNQNVLIDTIPNQMVDSFCDQIEMLDFLPEVKNFTEKLCGPKAPFGIAEVILSEKGSRLFRSFTVVSPESTTNALYEIISTLDIRALKAIDSEVRRNLVWGLERLTFHSDQFSKSAWCLLLLAKAENENWSNNATGMFSQLFRVQLSGTQAKPSIRFDLLNRAMKLNDNLVDMVLINALEKATATHGGSRTIGAEYQGTKPPLEEWKPTLWQDIFDIWENSFNLLLELSRRGLPQRTKVLEIIGHSIRGFVSRGRIKMLDQAIEQLIEVNGIYWPEALDSIKSAFEYDRDGMKQEAEDALNKWLEQLNPNNAEIDDKLKILVVNPPWETQKNENDEYVDVASENAKCLAKQFNHKLEELVPFIKILLEGEQKQAHSFGYQLALENLDIDDFLICALQELQNVNTPNPNLIYGMYRGIYERSKEIWQQYIDYVVEHSEYVELYPDLIRTGLIDKKHLDCFLELISKNLIPLSSPSSLTYGRVTESIEPTVMSDFCLSLVQINEKTSWSALDVMYMYCYGDREHLETLRDSIKSLIICVPLQSDKKEFRTDGHKWKSFAEKILNIRDEDFAISLTHQLISACKYELDHSDIWHYYKPLLLKIMTEYDEKLWPIFGNAVLKAKGVELYWLQQLLDRENSFTNKTPSVLSVVSVENLIKWCKNKPEQAPKFVASCLNIFDVKDDTQIPSQLFVSILENFGKEDKVKVALNANMSSRGWSGSLVPYLEADIDALSTLVDHRNSAVRSWVKDCISNLKQQIAYESSRDEEQQLGIY
jgi:pimeloyl-ACP methyl ester carboxylesterase